MNTCVLWRSFKVIELEGPFVDFDVMFQIVIVYVLDFRLFLHLECDKSFLAQDVRTCVTSPVNQN